MEEYCLVNVEVPAGDKQTKLMDEPFQKAQEPEWSKEALVARKNHNPPSNIHAPHTAQASHRSRSPPRPREPPGDDKRPISVPRSPSVVPILTFPAEDANQAPHLTAVVKAQSRSCRCPLVVEVPAMTSTKMIVIATAHQDAHTVLLNLRTLQLGANMMGLQNAMITPIAKPITVTIPTYWQDWDAWGTWGT
jgi:hypothetical protein